MPGIRKSASDHRPSWLLVQEALVLLILCILCIDVQFVENQLNGTWQRPAIANWDPLFHSRVIRSAGRGDGLGSGILVGVRFYGYNSLNNPINPSRFDSFLMRGME